MNAEETRTTDWYLDHLIADVERFASVLETTANDAPIAACPGWDVSRLAEHLGQIHRWAEFCAANARPPSDDDAAALAPFDPDHSVAWLRDGARSLVTTLRALDPAAPTWHPFTVDRVAAVWPRRQAHETAIHRWDAEHAVGIEATIDAPLASDGIDEYFELAVPRLMARKHLDAPSGSLHVHCTDVDGEWLVWAEDGQYQMIREHAKGDAALRGPADAILLRLWGRDHRPTELSPVGDDSVLTAWLSFAGM